MNYYINPEMAYKVLTGAWGRDELFECAIQDRKIAMILFTHSSTTQEERQRILVKQSRISDYADLIKKNKLTDNEEEYLLNVAFSNCENDVIYYIEYKRNIKPEIFNKIIRFLCKSPQCAWNLIRTNDAFKKLSEDNKNKIYEVISKDQRYAPNLLRDKPNLIYREQCITTMTKTGEGAYNTLYNSKHFRLTRVEEDKCIAKIANFKTYLRSMLHNLGINLWKEQVDVIVDTVIEKQDLELIKITWDMATLTEEQKTKLEPFVLAHKLLKAK